MGTSTDPVGNGYVASLAHPGGNTTGLASSQDDYAPKQLQLLAMLVPNLSRIGFLVNPNNPFHVPLLKLAQEAVRNAGITLVQAEIRDRQDVERAFALLTNERVGAVLSSGDAVFFSARQPIVEIALRSRLPTMFSQREYVEAGGLMSYRRKALLIYIGALHSMWQNSQGAAPADLPIQQPTKLYVVINRKTADVLGCTIPIELLATADEVIE